MVCSREVGIEALTRICNEVFITYSGGSMPLDWMDSVLVPLYKGKGDVRECGSYREGGEATGTRYEGVGKSFRKEAKKEDSSG